MIILAFSSGLRYAELLGLTWDDVLFDKMQLNIKKSYDYHYHSGMKKTKTESSNRKIPINKDIIEMLKQYKKDQQELFNEFNVKNPLNQIFYHYIEGIVTNNTVNKSLRRALMKLKITPVITMHGARHTWGSILLYQGIDVITISKLLGHKDTTVTQRVYMHQLKEMEEQNNMKINQVTIKLFEPVVDLK